MIGVDLIGQIRCWAYFEQQRPIKEIVRMLSVSRATVRKVIRRPSDRVQVRAAACSRTPKLGEWVAILSEILEKGSEAAPARNGARLSACSRSYADAAMTVRTTVCTGS